MTTKRQRPLALRRASAYFRLAAKADRAGEYRKGEQYREIAWRLVDGERRNREARVQRAAAEAAWKAKARG